jgi:hypothetical protein
MPAWSDPSAASWGMLLALGAFHGINPGMGWLFAVALGMQEDRPAAVWRAVLALALGHACAIAVVVFAGLVAGVVLPTHVLRWPIAAILVVLGIRRLFRHRHPRGFGMQISVAGLVLWSFLVATAHGAGLMVLPVWLQMSSAHGMHTHAGSDLASGLEATAVHSGTYLVVTAFIAWVVFGKLGVGLLRKAWINVDVVWALALIASGGLTLWMLA